MDSYVSRYMQNIVIWDAKSNKITPFFISLECFSAAVTLVVVWYLCFLLFTTTGTNRSAEKAHCLVPCCGFVHGKARSVVAEGHNVT